LNIELRITKNDSERRLDRVLRKAFQDMPISAIHRLFRKKCVLLDGKPAYPFTITKEGETLLVKHAVQNKNSCMGEAANETKPQAVSCKHKLRDKAQILFEGNGILVLNKICGIASHGENSLETLAACYLKDKIMPSLSFKSGPLHRLDKPTSGIITFSTSLEGARHFSFLMQNGLIKKTYLAIMEGVIEDYALWEDFVTRDTRIKKTFVTSTNNMQDAKTALSTVRRIAHNTNLSLVSVEIETGRTHQIRACAAHHKHPLMGDKKYGSKRETPFFLHAMSMEFPKDNQFGIQKINASPPEEFLKTIEILFKEDRTRFCAESQQNLRY
jgi:23S rRNA pseudouridine955/2504/2580 synthase